MIHLETSPNQIKSILDEIENYCGEIIPDSFDFFDLPSRAVKSQLKTNARACLNIQAYPEFQHASSKSIGTLEESLKCLHAKLTQGLQSD